MGMYDSFFTPAGYRPTASGYSMQTRPSPGAAYGQVDPSQAQQAAQRNRKEAYNLAWSGINRAGGGGGSSDDMIRQQLQAAARGQNAPFSAATRSAMLGQSADQAAAAAGARSMMMSDQLAAGGGSINDPSYQAMMRQNLGQQQGDVQRARQGIETQAAQANYAAQQSALGQLASYDAQRRAEQTAAEQRLQQMLLQEQFGAGYTGRGGSGGGMAGGGAAGGGTMGRR